jgi:alpha-L-rhamnosidase
MPKKNAFSRRLFLKKGTTLGALPFAAISADKNSDQPSAALREALAAYRRSPAPLAKPLDLSPARWVWYPSARTLPNTFILFRRVFALEGRLRAAKGWLLADSRYLLFVNGRRVQFGPAPADPRFSEADPIDLGEYLAEGENVVGVQALYYGHGEGTWPIGKPGFIFRLELEYEQNILHTIVSDGDWHCALCRAWPPGQYKRWYLRALQEDFDARRYPYGWATPGFQPGAEWLPVMVLEGRADQTALATGYSDYLLDSSALATPTRLLERSVPMMDESPSPAAGLANSFAVRWLRPVRDYFDLLTPEAYATRPFAVSKGPGKGEWRFSPPPGEAVALTFYFHEQLVGFPYFQIEASAGTIVELMVQEGHEPQRRIVMNNHFHSWTRFTCQEGLNRFETFDFESFRWLQLHIRDAEGPVRVSGVGARRRGYPWPQAPRYEVSDEALTKVLDAAVNTLRNAAQDTLVDGMGRERQQYSGDIGHALHAIYFAFGDQRLPARYARTYSQGLTKDGFFLDCWPAYDRLARLAQRQLDLTPWGPLLDHGVGFVFDCFHIYRYTGERAPLEEVFPRLLIFYDYLRRLRARDGLLPVEDIGVPTVWMDSDAYSRQRHKQCAFNLYVAAMLEYALGPLCRVFGQESLAWEAEGFGRDLLRAAQHYFWDDKRRLFINNLPWLQEEGEARLCDRSLATALLYDQCPNGRTDIVSRALALPLAELGLSFPANAGWRYWALARHGRVEPILRDIRTRWAVMASVAQNNTLQEHWHVQPDSNSQWSHCPMAPLYVLYMCLAGIEPLSPGFAKVLIRPQPGDLRRLALTAHTVRGPIDFELEREKNRHRLSLTLPPDVEGILALPNGVNVKLPGAEGPRWPGLRYFQLPGDGKTTRVEWRD